MGLAAIGQKIGAGLKKFANSDAGKAAIGTAAAGLTGGISAGVAGLFNRKDKKGTATNYGSSGSGSSGSSIMLTDDQKKYGIIGLIVAVLVFIIYKLRQ